MKENQFVTVKQSTDCYTVHFEAIFGKYSLGFVVGSFRVNYFI